jgi:cytochrome c oxidase accessory protein FixG
MNEAESNVLVNESFRDTIATVDDKGNRIWMYPKKPKGKYTNYRYLVSSIFLAFLFMVPFVRINGAPLLMLNIIERKFVLFGIIFWPQDFHLFLIGMITFVVFIVLFTVVYGRLFCGWACPQTIFMEMVFRKVEYLIEGNWREQQALDRATLSATKILKKTMKHSIFFLLAMVISNLFLMYIIGSDEWWKIVTDKPENHMAGLGSILAFALVFYAVYARFREQVCTAVCPYGRLQGVMMDKNSIVVAYDYKKGENRAKIHKGENREVTGKGNCIDCHHCVDVCPTGIDIRNGVQMECVNCTACIDACDEIMIKVNLPTGLIRYASENNIALGEKFRWTKRMIGYSSVLMLLVGLLVVLLSTRSDVETSILRTPGVLYQKLEDNKYGNLYNLKIINKTNRKIPLQLKLENSTGEIRMVGKTPELKASSIAEGALFIVLKESDIKRLKTKIDVGIYEGDQLIEKVTTIFVGPVK